MPAVARLLLCITRLPRRMRGSVDSSLVSESIWAWSLIQIRLIERDDVRRLV